MSAVPSAPYLVTLTDEQHRPDPSGQGHLRATGRVVRARIMLAAAQGATNAAIAAHLGLHIDTVRKGGARFCTTGIDGLADASRCRRPAASAPRWWPD
jgi:hypothetical protein